MTCREIARNAKVLKYCSVFRLLCDSRCLMFINIHQLDVLHQEISWIFTVWSARLYYVLKCPKQYADMSHKPGNIMWIMIATWISFLFDDTPRDRNESGLDAFFLHSVRGKDFKDQTPRPRTSRFVNRIQDFLCWRRTVWKGTPKGLRRLMNTYCTCITFMFSS